MIGTGKTGMLRAGLAGLLAVHLGVTGCASSGDTRDPLEGFNRGVYEFNEVVDKTLIKPVARGYQAIMPDVLDKAISNFFANLGDVVTAVNDFLQGKFLHAFEDAGRVVFNSTFGMAGLVDIATGFGIQRRNEDFGQTLGYWGVVEGPYLVLPILGPSTIRDTVGLAVDTAFFDPIFYADGAARMAALGVKLIDRRADLLSTEKVVDTAAIDRYSFIRDAYLQRRQHLIYDGNPPQK